jgi:hypothetical protein
MGAAETSLYHLEAVEKRFDSIRATSENGLKCSTRERRCGQWLARSLANERVSPNASRLIQRLLSFSGSS